MPVSFAEIQRVSALCEVMGLGNVIPDVSLGSHFFNDLVESNMLYLALHPGYAGHALDLDRLRAAPNRLPELLPDDARLAPVVRVIDFPAPGDGRVLWLNANSVAQEVDLLPRPGGRGRVSVEPPASPRAASPRAYRPYGLLARLLRYPAVRGSSHEARRPHSWSASPGPVHGC